MSDRPETPGLPEPDSALIRSLAALLTETGLTEIEYAVGDRRLRVARVGAAPAAFAAAPAAAAVAVANTAPDIAADHPGALKSPMVGTVYLASQPGAPAFVRVGDVVTEGQPLLIIEAMKVMNQIRAPRAGRVREIAVEDASPVEYGALLMVIE